jgi:hypothetical protein
MNHVHHANSLIDCKEDPIHVRLAPVVEYPNGMGGVETLRRNRTAVWMPIEREHLLFEPR